MRLLITVPDLAEESGGPSMSSVRTAEQAAQLGAEVAIAFQDDGRKRLVATGVENFALPATGRFPWSVYLRHRRALDTVLARFAPNVVYDFGLWLPQNLASAHAAAERRLPWITSPRGMLEPWSRGSKQLKKMIAWRAYQRRVLLGARTLVATSTEEEDNLRQLLPKSEVWLIPNGVDLPPERPSAGGPDRQALFLSRLDAKKQPDLLIRAWGEVRAPGWRLVIAGPGTEEYRHSLRQLIAETAPGTHIELRPAAFGPEKEELFRDSHLFVLPTFSENFGIVIAEALANGLPVITTTGTPWADIGKLGCGWYVQPELGPVREALRAACATSPGDLSAMGRRGRALAETFSWTHTAQLLLAHCTALARPDRAGG